MRAGESVMTVAMVEHHQPPAASNVSVQTSPPSGLDNSLSKSTNSSPATAQKEIAVQYSTDTRLEKTAKSGADEAFQFVHKNLSSSSRSNVAFSVQAGYGRIWDEQSMLSRISGGHQETGCAYVGAKISF